VVIFITLLDLISHSKIITIICSTLNYQDKTFLVEATLLFVLLKNLVFIVFNGTKIKWKMKKDLFICYL